MGILNNLNINYLRVFEAVYRTRSMTLAARDLHLTQSGISQQIKLLENLIGVKLFDRVGKRIIPTTRAKTLYKECSSSFDNIEATLKKITTKQHELAGTIALGIPDEFGTNVILPLVGQFMRMHKKVDVKIHVGLASIMNELLLNGTIDFAFIDEFPMDPNIEAHSVYEEVLDLCIAPSLFKRYGKPKNQKSYFQKLDYIEYLESAPVLPMWFQHHFKIKPVHLDLNIKAYAMNSKGVARLVLEGIGAGVIPRYLLQQLVKDGHRLYSFYGQKTPLKNDISIAFVKERSHSEQACANINWLFESLGKRQKLNKFD